MSGNRDKRALVRCGRYLGHIGASATWSSRSPRSLVRVEVLTGPASHSLGISACNGGIRPPVDAGRQI